MLRPATIDDAFALAPRLRAADIAEVRAAGHEHMDVVLAESIAASAEAWAYEVNGTVHAIMGLVEVTGGVPWLLGSNELFKQGRDLLTLPQPFLERWLAKYGVLANMVHTDNHRSIRWLKHLGFTIGEAFQLNGHSFHPFYMRQAYV